MTVILLNGVGSAGKSSIARALQDSLAGVWLHVAMDAFIEMLPPYLQDDPSTFEYRDIGAENGRPEIEIRSGEAGERLLSGMRRAIAALAGAGNNLIVDDVVIGSGLADYDAQLASIPFHKVGVRAPLDVLEARESARSDRMPGLARWQFSRVHAGARYDFEVDTSVSGPGVCAGLIADRFGPERRGDFHI